MPRVSVVIPCYNAARFIAETVRSALAQTFADLEVIVIDDGSTDGSPAVVETIADPRLRLLHQANAGPAAARNTGIRAARGEYIAFLDADDLALPERVAHQVQILEADPGLALVAGGYTWIDEQGHELPGFHSWKGHFDLNNLADWLLDCPVVPAVITMRRSAWQRVGGFDERYMGPEDWKFWLQLVLAGERMTWSKEVVARYRRLPATVSSDGNRMVEQCTRVLREIRHHRHFPPALEGVWRQGIALRYLDGAKRQFLTGWWREGRVNIDAAIRLDASLLYGAPCRIELELVNVALDPLVSDPLAVLESAFRHLPQSASLLRERRDAAVCRYHLVTAEHSLRARRWRAAASNALLAWSLQPGLLLRRQTWTQAWALMAGAA